MGRKEEIMSVRIENWSITSKATPYTPPECHFIRIHGEVYGHPMFDDGAEVTTSDVLEVSGSVVQTRSREYILGDPNPDYVKWCLDNNMSPPTPEEPIRVKPRNLAPPKQRG